MLVRHYALGKFYTISCPEGTRLVRRSESAAVGMASHDHLVVPLGDETIRIPADPPELIPMLAESGNFGISLLGEPVAEEGLAGLACPGCSESDVAWLRLRDDSETVHCDRCGSEFPAEQTAKQQATKAIKSTRSADI